MATILERPVTCKCGTVIETLEAGKVHYLLMASFPWMHTNPPQTSLDSFRRR